MFHYLKRSSNGGVCVRTITWLLSRIQWLPMNICCLFSGAMDTVRIHRIEIGRRRCSVMLINFVRILEVNALVRRIIQCLFTCSELRLKGSLSSIA